MVVDKVLQYGVNTKGYIDNFACIVNKFNGPGDSHGCC